MTCIIGQPNHGRITHLAPGGNIQAALDYYTGSWDTPFAVGLGVGAYYPDAEIVMPDHGHLIGTARMGTAIINEENNDSVIATNHDATEIRNLRTQTGWGSERNHIEIGDSSHGTIDNVYCSRGNGSAIAFNHSVGHTDKWNVITNFESASTKKSCIKNIGSGYARIDLRGAHLSCSGNSPATCHGIDGHFVGNINGFRIGNCGGNNINIVGSVRGLSITEGHLEQPRNGANVILENCQNVRVRGLQMTTSAPYLCDAGLSLINCQNCYVEKSVFDISDANTNVGFRAFTADANCTDCRFEHNVLRGSYTGDRDLYDVSVGNTTE